MRRVRLAFSDFVGLMLEPPHNVVLRALREACEVTIVGMDEKPDLLVYSDFGESHWRFDGLKVYLTGENMLPDFDQCDLAFTPADVPGDPRAVRLPYYAQTSLDLGRLVRPPGFDPSAELARPGFCAFVVSNPRSPERNAFFRMLNRLRRVDSGGRHFNNMGGPVPDKMAFIRNYRFTLAFENTCSPGYTTEKLVEPLLAGSIPIYWGNPDVSRDFDPGCMVNVSDFPDLESAAEHMLALDADREARLRLLRSPVFAGNTLPACATQGHVREPILRLLDTGKPGKRVYRHRRLREHVYGSWARQTWVSLSCRAESRLWDLGFRR